MQDEPAFLGAVLDSVFDQIAVVAADGRIVYVNAAWKEFGEANACTITGSWEGVNYLQTCDAAATDGEWQGETAARGLRQVLAGQRREFYFEYPCHGPDEQRWFMMSARALRSSGWPECFVVSHRNITQRKLLEDQLRELALTDELTGLDNRRQFDRVLEQEWRRCARSDQPICLLLLDLDCFKDFNDEYGHVAGDECLAQVASTLKSCARRPGDHVARYGGEEFAMILAETDLHGAEIIATRVLEAVRALAIEHRSSSAGDIVTLSIGIAGRRPSAADPATRIIEYADDALYMAKEAGRNRYTVHPVE